MKILPTQYLYIKFPTVSIYQRHPFSIASITRDTDTRMVSVVLHVKALGTWTKSLQEAEGGQVGSHWLVCLNSHGSTFLCVASPHAR